MSRMAATGGSAEKRIIGHSGGASGISAVAYIFPESGYLAIILSNYDGGSYYPGEYILDQIKAMTK